MANLKVKSDWAGPGEKFTAEHLRDHLPEDWVIFAGRRLAGTNRDDVDLIVVGTSRIFVLDEKHWGPRVVVDDSNWYVKNEARPNPLGRVGQLARKVAGLLKANAKGYQNVKGKRVLAGVVLSHPKLTLVSGTKHDTSELIWALSQAADEMVKLDKADAPIGPSRNAVIAYLDDLPKIDRVTGIGGYKNLERLSMPGIEQAYEAEDASGQKVILKCYPIARLEELGDPSEFLARETKALNRLADVSRTWRSLPFFRDDSYGYFVVPVVPSPNARNLVKSVKQSDPARPGGHLDSDEARRIVRDAYRALADVHAEGLTHRALHPSRIWLGKQMRVMFSDFHLARIDGSVTITPWEPDNDISEDYRSPEAAPSIGTAGPKSDVYSLTLCMAGWLLGIDPRDLTIADLKKKTQEAYGWSGPILNGLNAKAADRPTPEEVSDALADAPAPAVAPAPAESDDFIENGIVAGRYQLVRKLGEGGFAISWKVFDKQAGHHKVLKQFKRQVTDDLRAEYKVADTLSSDYCGRVYDVQVDAYPNYLVSEYVDGQSLASEGFPLTVGEISEISISVLKALAYIHGKGLVHGDVTPANIIAATDGNGSAKLIDFGLAIPAGDRPAGWNPRFAAPEVVAGQPANPRSDLFGFAASVLFAMLGRPVTRLEDGVLGIQGPTADEYRTWGAEGQALIDVLLDGLSAEPQDRPNNADAFLTLVRGAKPPIQKVGPADHDLAEVVNPQVAALRRLYRGSAAGNAGNRGLDDDFAKQTYVPTRLDTGVLPQVLAGGLDVVLLSGNPGDGKTSVLVMLADELRTQGGDVEHEDDAGWRIRLNDRLFIAVFDASESHGDLTSDDLVREALAPVAAGEEATALIAINDGRLLQFFTDHEDEYEEWSFAIKDQLDGLPSPDPRIVLVDLKTRSLAGLDTPGPARKVLDILVSASIFDDCAGCVAKHDCPILANRNLLANHGADAFDELVLISHLRRRRRATFRDLRSAISWLVTGDRNCHDVHAWRAENRSALHLDAALTPNLAFDHTSNDYLVQEWSQFDPALVASPDADRLSRIRSGPDSNPMFDSVTAVTRALYFDHPELVGTAVDRRQVRLYRYLDEFLNMLRGSNPEQSRDRILLGISRLAGAHGYHEPGLAVSSGMPTATWAILHTIEAEEFALTAADQPAPYVETIPDRLTLRHGYGGPTFDLSLDTAEIILRAADGEIVNDLASDAIVQEIDAFIGQLSRQPSVSALIVDASGSVAKARVDGTAIVLEKA